MWINNIKITTGHIGKMEGIYSINTNTLTNEFCKKMYNCNNKNIICTNCYSYEMLDTYRKSAIPSYQNNSEVLSRDIIPESELPRLNTLYVRLHAHGELIDDNHLINYINLCNKNNRITFVLWTKRIKLVNDVLKDYDKPDNLMIVYSNPDKNNIIRVIPKHFDKVFNVITYDSDNINCGNKKCIDCLNCYEKNGNDIVIEKIKDYSKN